MISLNVILTNVMNDLEKNNALKKKRLISKSKHSHDTIVFSSLILKHIVNKNSNRTKNSYLNEKRLQFLNVRDVKNENEIIKINFNIIDIENLSILKK